MFTEDGQFRRYTDGYHAAMMAPDEATRQRVIDGLSPDVRELVRSLVAASVIFDDVQPMSAARLAEIVSENRGKKAAKVAAWCLGKPDPLSYLPRVPAEIRADVERRIRNELEPQRGTDGEEEGEP